MLAEINRDQHLTMLVLVVILMLIGAQLLYFTRQQVSAAQAQRSRDRMTSLLQSVADDYLCLISVDLNTQQEELFRLRESCGSGGLDRAATPTIPTACRNSPGSSSALRTVTGSSAPPGWTRCCPCWSASGSFISNTMPSPAASSSICKASSFWTAAIPGSPRLLSGVRNITELTHERIRTRTSMDLDRLRRQHRVPLHSGGEPDEKRGFHRL